MRLLSGSLVSFPGGSDGKASACNAGDPGLVPGLRRSPGEGNGNPLQYSCLENPTDRGAWWATIHRVTKSRMRLSELHFYFLAPSLYGLRPSVTTPQKPPHTPREQAAFLSKLLWWTTFVPIELFCSVCYLKIGKNNNRNWARQNLKDGRIELHCTGGEGLLQAVAG